MKNETKAEKIIRKEIEKYSILKPTSMAKDIIKELKKANLISSNLPVMLSLPNDDEPYFGWCDVRGCKNEGCSGGNAWRDTGYWTVCSKHSQEHREGKPQPKMKQEAVNREMSRLPDGTLPF